MARHFPSGAALPLSTDDFLHPSHTALIMWDFQKGLAGKAINAAGVLTSAQRLVSAADRNDVPVFWSRHVLPPLDLMSGPFKLFLMKKQKAAHPDDIAPTMQHGMEETDFVDGLAPAANHVVIEKSQPSFFIDTSLDLRLKTLGVRTLVLAGVATDIGVEFTARHAAALGYFSSIAEDATGSYTPEAQARSIGFLSSWITPVLQVDEISAAWDRLGASGGQDK